MIILRQCNFSKDNTVDNFLEIEKEFGIKLPIQLLYNLSEVLPKELDREGDEYTTFDLVDEDMMKSFKSPSSAKNIFPIIQLDWNKRDKICFDGKNTFYFYQENKTPEKLGNWNAVVNKIKSIIKEDFKYTENNKSAADDIRDILDYNKKLISAISKVKPELNNDKLRNSSNNSSSLINEEKFGDELKKLMGKHQKELSQVKGILGVKYNPETTLLIQEVNNHKDSLDIHLRFVSDSIWYKGDENKFQLKYPSSFIGYKEVDLGNFSDFIQSFKKLIDGRTISKNTPDKISGHINKLKGNSSLDKFLKKCDEEILKLLQKY